MLTRFEVKGFKSLLDVGVDLGAVNVFIGANGSGKTNLLEALGFLGTVAFSNLEYEGFRYRGIRPGNPNSFFCQFPNNINSTMKLIATANDSSYHLTMAESPSEQWLIDEESLTASGQEILLRNLQILALRGKSIQSMKFSNTAKSLVQPVRALMSIPGI